MCARCFDEWVLGGNGREDGIEGPLSTPPTCGCCLLCERARNGGRERGTAEHEGTERWGEVHRTPEVVVG